MGAVPLHEGGVSPACAIVVLGAADCPCCRLAGEEGPSHAGTQQCLIWGQVSLAGGLENLFHHTGNTPPRRSASPERGGADSARADAAARAGQPEANTVEADYLEHVCSVLQHL